MFFVPIIAGWALGVTSAKLVDTRRSRALSLSKGKANTTPPPSPKKQVELLLKEVDDRYQGVIHNTIDRMFGGHYEKHLQALGGTTGVDGIPELVKQRNRQAGYAGVSLALVSTGVPLLMASSFAINFYLGLVMIQIGIDDMRKKRKFTARGRGVLVYLGVMLTGYLAVQSAALMMGLLIEKLIATVQGQSHERLVSVFGDLPQTVSRLEDGVIASCPLAAVEAGDIVVVYAGEVVPVDGEIIASVMGGYEGHRGWVNYLAVSNEHRRKGYGVVLMRRIEALLLERGCPKLNLQVRRSNESVLAFYHAMGYGEDEVVSLGKRLIPDKPSE